jgi:hypothetical protein
MRLAKEMRPWILGCFAIYAPNLRVAQQVYQVVISRNYQEAFGTVLLNTGHEVEWVDMSLPVKKPVQ